MTKIINVDVLIAACHIRFILKHTAGINVNSLVASFGKYIKVYVHKDSASQCPPSVEQPNAFQILMSSQARRSTQTLPPCVAKPRNKKEELHNAIIGFFQAENLAWTPSL